MDHFLKVDGIIAAQSIHVESAFKSILSEFKTIIEIGFDRGAFSLWLYKNKKNTTKLVSYDISFGGKEVDNSSIDFRQGDCFNNDIVEEIRLLINSKGKTLVLCDGGNKEGEFNLYSQYLKTGDVIMLHDYAHSAEDYESVKYNTGWKTAAESRFSNIQNSIQINNLIPYHYDTFKNVLWGSFEKQS